MSTNMTMKSLDDKDRVEDKKQDRLRLFGGFLAYQRSTSITEAPDDYDDGISDEDNNHANRTHSQRHHHDDLSASFFYEGRPAPSDFDVEWVVDNRGHNNDNLALPYNSDDGDNNDDAHGDVDDVVKRQRRRRQRQNTRLFLSIFVVCIAILAAGISLGLLLVRSEARDKISDIPTFVGNTTSDNDDVDVDVHSTDDNDDDVVVDVDNFGDIGTDDDIVVDTTDDEDDKHDGDVEDLSTASPTIPPPTSPAPTPAPSSSSSQPAISVILQSNQFLELGDFRSSPSGKYMVGLVVDDGRLALIKQDDDGETLVWSSGVTGGHRCFVQADGNVIVRDQNQQAIWSTETHGNPGAKLVVSDQGQIALVDQSTSTAIWLQGIPRQSYTGPSSDDLAFPIRGAFYYPWYPQTWFIGDSRAHYISSMGMYSSSDPSVATFHVEAMDYAHIDLAIASWWGPSTHLDRARITMLMDETLRQQSSLKWTVYHEVERDHNQTVEEIRNDLAYLKKWYAWHPSYAHIDGRPLIFVYNEKGCDVARRWSEASQGEWYVVLKIFPKALDCEFQPDAFHQYGVGEKDGTIHNPSHSFVLSPGFWRADKDTPMVPRVDASTFCENTKRMVKSNEPWQLIVSFSEAGEGTMIEPSPEWQSTSGYGSYLDCLHENF